MNNTEENIYFNYVDENGTTKRAEVLTLFSLESNANRKYALCSVPTNDGNFDIMVFIVNEKENNQVSFDDILDEKELSEVTAAANNIINR